MAVQSLQDTTNYNEQFNRNTTEIFARYTTLILEYLFRCAEVLDTKNIDYFKYILVRGLNTISHVFKILLLYTKNIEVASHHTQRAYYYYVEFIGQIGSDSHTYLQLNSKDASLFVYKKTIFDINNEFRKEFASVIGTDTIMENVETLIHIYNSCLLERIYKYKLTQDSVIHFIKMINNDITKIIQHVLNLSLGRTEKHYGDKLKIIQQLNNIISSSNKKSTVNTFQIIECFSKKLKTRTISVEDIHKRILQNNHKEMIETLTPLRYVNWLFMKNKS